MSYNQDNDNYGGGNQGGGGFDNSNQGGGFGGGNQGGGFDNNNQGGGFGGGNQGGGYGGGSNDNNQGGGFGGGGGYDNSNQGGGGYGGNNDSNQGGGFGGNNQGGGFGGNNNSNDDQNSQGNNQSSGGFGGSSNSNQSSSGGAVGEGLSYLENKAGVNPGNSVNSEISQGVSKYLYNQDIAQATNTGDNNFSQPQTQPRAPPGAGATQAGGNGDALDKGVDFLERKGGHEQSHSTTEKISDSLRKGYKKTTGKDVPIEDKTYS